MRRTYLSVAETLRAFGRSVPGYALMYLVVMVVVGLATQDPEVPFFMVFFAVALTPILWLRWEGTSRSPMASPKTLPLAIAWFGVCTAVMFLLGSFGIFD